MSTYILLAIGCLIFGGVVGYLFARYRNRNDDHEIKLAALQSEYDKYRAEVRNHYIDTVSAIGRIDAEQKKLYRSVAEGVTGLCRPDNGEDDYFLEETMRTLGRLEPPEKSKEDKST